MSKTNRTVSMIVEVEITVSDGAPEDVISRGITDDFREVLYDFRSEDEVIEHLAYNCIANGVEDAVRLDGWADLEPGLLTMAVVDVSKF